MQLPKDRIGRVYVRAPNWLGDVIMATPAFARIRSFFAEAEIVCGIKRGHAPILAGSKSFDRYLHVGKPRGLGGTLEQAKLLRDERFDCAILFPNSASSALVCMLAGIKYRIGYTQGRRLLMTHGVRFKGHKKPFWKRQGPRREPVPMVDYYFALLDAFEMPRCGPQPILRVTPDEEAECAKLFAQHSVEGDALLILFAPTAGFGPSKMWANERWAELAKALLAAQPKARILALCGPGEETVVEDIVARVDDERVRVPLPPVPLDVLKPLVRRADLMVTLDSGPRHLAVAFDTPHVVLMGPTDPGYTASNVEHGVVLRHDVECGPCHKPICPLDHHECMQLITVDEAVEAALTRIRQRV